MISDINSVINYDSMSFNELNSEMDKNCDKIGKQMYKLTRNLQNVSDKLSYSYYRDDRKDIQYDTDFDNIENFEYELDELFDKFKTIKQNIKDVRLGKIILKNKIQNGENQNRRELSQ